MGLTRALASCAAVGGWRAECDVDSGAYRAGKQVAGGDLEVCAPTEAAAAGRD